MSIPVPLRMSEVTSVQAPLTNSSTSMSRGVIGNGGVIGDRTTAGFAVPTPAAALALGVLDVVVAVALGAVPMPCAAVGLTVIAAIGCTSKAAMLLSNAVA